MIEATAGNLLWDVITARVKATPGPVTPGGLPIFGPVKVYPDGTAPKTAVPGYLLYGQAPETPDGFMDGQAGLAGLYFIHCWADTKPNAVRLFTWLKQLILAVPLTLDNFDVDVTVSKDGEVADLTGSAWQVPARLTVALVQRA